jgi:DNA polymerase-1
MLEVEAALTAAGLGGRMLLQIHDELLFEVPESEVAATAGTVRRVMQAVVPLKVPLEVDLRVGKTWGELAPYEKKA